MKIVTSQVKCSLMEMFLSENNVCSVVQCFPMFDTCMYQKIYFNFGSSNSLFECVRNDKGGKGEYFLMQHYKAVGHFEND